MVIIANKTKVMTPKQEASSVETLPDRLSVLAELPDIAVQRLVANNPITPPKALELLGHNSDKAIRKAVAGNPNSPSDTLTSLGAQFPLELLRNQALDWLLLENPSMLSEMPEETQGAIAKREDCTPEMLSHLGRAGSGRSLLLALIQNGKTPPATIKQIYEADTSNLAAQFGMSEDNVRKIQPIAGMHIGMMPEPTAEKAYEIFWTAISGVPCLAKSDWPLFQVADIPEFIKLEALAFRMLNIWPESSISYDDDSDFFPPLMDDFPPTFIEVLAVTAKNKRQLTALGKLTNTPQWLKGISSPDDAINAISDHRQQCLFELDKLIGINSKILHMFLSAHPLTSGRLDARRILADLSNDGRPGVVEYVAEHSSTPNEILGELMQKHSVKNALPIQRYFDERVLCGIAENPNGPSSILESLGLVDKYEWVDVKESVARNPSTPASVLSIMAATKDYGVEISLAENTNTPSEIFEKLSRTTDNLICTRLAENPSVPPSVLEILSKSKDQEVLELLAKNPNTPESAIALIARTDDDWTLENVAVHPNVSSEVLGKLIKKDLIYDEKVLRQIAGNPRTPVDALKKLAREDDPSIKRAVATNPSSPVDLLQILCDDDASSVRSVAKKVIKTRKID